MSSPTPVRRGERGFSLVELLIIMVILTILAAIAIPNLYSAKRTGNEASAVSSLRSLNTAQWLHRMTGSADGSYADVGTLRAGKHIDDVLASGRKSGYDFEFRMVGPSNKLYTFTAKPTLHTSGAWLRATGGRSFSMPESGVIYWNDTATPPVIDEVTRLPTNPARDKPLE